MVESPGTPSASPRARPPQGSAAEPGSGQVLHSGRARHSVNLGAYLKWGVTAVLLGVGGWWAMRLDAARNLPLYLLALVGLGGMGHAYLRHITTIYKVTTRRVELERGILAKEVDSLELWRVLDVTFRQSVLDRMLGNARIVLVSTDQTHSELVLHGLPEPRKIFEALREAVQVARHTSRPMELVGQDGAMELQ